MHAHADPASVPVWGPQLADLVATDEELVQRAVVHDRGAWEALVRRHYGAAFAVALAVLGERADAEDVCHEGFVRAGAALAGCRHPDRFREWLCTIVRNASRNRLTRDPSRRHQDIDTAVTMSADNPADDLLRHDLGARLLAALTLLSPVQREVLLLHDLDGRSHREIAAIVGTTEAGSRQQLFKARRRMRSIPDVRLLKEEFDDS